MTEKYRKLSNDELTTLAYQILAKVSKPTAIQRQITEHAKRYYPTSACSAILTINSEYNDNTYDNSPGVLVVYDCNGVEVVPLPETARQSRNEWRNFEVPTDSTEEQAADIVIHIGNQNIPELYIKSV